MKSLVNKICKQLYKRENISEVVSYNFSKEIMNRGQQFLIIVKPECLMINEGVNTEQILTKLFEIFKQNYVYINSVLLVNGCFLKRDNLVEQQYSMLNKWAKTSFEQIPRNYQNIIKSKYDDRNIIGSFKFLDKHSEISVKELEILSHKKGSEKVGNGIYIFPYEADGERYGIINAFHPHQIEYLSQDNNYLLLLNCSSVTDYVRLADELIGFYIPEFAKKDSMRNFIYENRNLNIPNVSTFYNGFHISPSPLEGMFGIIRYWFRNENLADALKKTTLGVNLLETGMGVDEIIKMRENPIIFETNSTLFDMVEGKNMDYVINYVLENRNKLQYY